MASNKGDWEDVPVNDGWEDVPVEKPNYIESALLGAADYGTAGFADEIGGALAHPIGAGKAIIGQNDEDVKKYKGTRDAIRKAEENAKKENPLTYHGAGITTAVVGPGKLISGAKGVMALGGLSGAGSSEAELSEGEYGKLAKDTGVGTAVAGLTHGAVTKGLPKVTSKLSHKIEAFMERFKGKAPVIESTTETIAPAASVSDEAIEAAKGIGKKVFSKAKPRPDAAKVAEAVKMLSGKEKVPSYMLTNDEMTQNLASTVLKDPTLAGEIERRSISPVMEGLENFGKEVSTRGTPKTNFQVGGEVKKGLSEEFAKRIAPAEQIYGELDGELSKVPINGLAFKRAMNALKKDAKLDYSGKSLALIDRLENTFTGNIDDIAKLRKFRTQLGRNLDQTASPAEREIIGKMYDVLTKERNRSILRYEGHIPDKAGMLNKLRAADSIYRKEIGNTTSALGIKTGKATARQSIADFLDKTPNEDIVKNLFDKGDFASIQQFQKAFPAQFDQLKSRVVSDIIDKSTHNGNLSTQKLVSNLNRYSPEVQELLMGDMAPKAKAAQTVLGALPRNFNPSDTATKMQFLDMFNPKVQAGSFARRAALHKKAPSSAVLGEALGPGAYKAKDGVHIIERLKSSPAGQRFVEPLAKALQRGDNSYAATYYLLSQSYPEFRKAIGEDKQSESDPETEGVQQAE
jgi:hypothetical protein